MDRFDFVVLQTTFCLLGLTLRFQLFKLIKCGTNTLLKYLYCSSIYIQNHSFGLVAQWTRARGYEPRCQGFESLLAQLY